MKTLSSVAVKLAIILGVSSFYGLVAVVFFHWLEPKLSETTLLLLVFAPVSILIAFWVYQKVPKYLDVE